MCGAGLRFEYNIVNSHLLSRHQMNFLEYKRRVAAGEWQKTEENEEGKESSEPDTTLTMVEVTPLAPTAFEGLSADDTGSSEEVEKQQQVAVQCQLCGKTLTLVALHSHLEWAHAMRLNESTGELEDIASPSTAAAGQARVVRRQRYEARHFLVAETPGNNGSDGENECEAVEAVTVLNREQEEEVAGFLSNGWSHTEEREEFDSSAVEQEANEDDGGMEGSYLPPDGGLEADILEACESGQELSAEYSDDPDAMCHQVCEMCGAEALVLRNHTRAAHGLNIAQYRELYPAFKFSSQVHHRENCLKNSRSKLKAGNCYELKRTGYPVLFSNKINGVEKDDDLLFCLKI
jgi:hypothetical protein